MKTTQDITTDAEKIAARFGHDGQCEWIVEGNDDISLEYALTEAGALARPHPDVYDLIRHELPDGSAIVTTAGGWDLGIPSTTGDDRRDCTCWAVDGECVDSDHCQCLCHK